MAVLSRCVWLLAGLSILSPVLAQNSIESSTASTQTSSAAPAETPSNVPTEDDFTSQEIEGGDALSQLQQMAQAESSVIAKRSLLRRAGSGCSASNIKIRKEWRTLPKPERRQYIAAVKCLQTKPSLFPPGQFAGAKSLFDDFVLIHFFGTLNIHFSGTFLLWHRYFTWAFENKLRTECGYTGTMPYWEWGLDVNNPASSPVFDGSDTSLGGDGEAIPHEGLIITEPGNPDALIPLPPGTGGGCVQTGPFKDMVVHLGPVALAQYGTTDVASSPDPLGDNSRCLKRDLNPGVAQRWNTFGNTTRLILQNHNIEMFQAILQGDPRYVHGELGVHGGGHFILGGDPGGDPFVSPGDPAFYFHHAQVDRVYWIWQLLDFPNRQDVFGTETLLDTPPSANVTLDTLIDLSPIAPPVKMRDLMSTIGGTPLCYIYL